MTYEIDNWRLQLDRVTLSQKEFLVRTIHIRHVIKVLMSSIVSFYQELALVEGLNPFHMWKLWFHGVCAFPI